MYSYKRKERTTNFYLVKDEETEEERQYLDAQLPKISRLSIFAQLLVQSFPNPMNSEKTLSFLEKVL
jgi:hypothetical protein